MNKKRFAIFSTSIAIMVLAVPLFAQAIRLRADIPFAFFVGERTMPAGEYALKSGDSALSPLVLRSADGRFGAFANSNPVWLSRIHSASPELVFKRYGDKYFLSEVLDRQENVGVTLPMTRTERALSENASTKTYDTVTILASR